tara:strand:- start:840 stop:1052 length:213 start_codon:yes stop_codon:yes gene_type:complete
MFSKAASSKDALKASIDALRQIVTLYDEQGLALPAVHAATALEAACFALENDEIGVGANIRTDAWKHRPN